MSSGYACLKLKIGVPGALDRELAQIETLRVRLGASIELRLDANGSLTTPEIERAWLRLEPVGIALFEEPGPPSRPRSLPLGLDESLQGLEVSAALVHVKRAAPSAIVLKPTSLGGIGHCWRLAESSEAPAVVSHCFDGPFAWRAAAALSLCLPPSAAHGLAPHSGLTAWPLASDACVRRGVLDRVDSLTELSKGAGNGEIGHAPYVMAIREVRLFTLREDLDAYRYKQLILVLSDPERRREYPPEASYYLGEAYRLRNQEGDAERSEREYTLSVELAPAFAPAYRALGLMHYKRQNKSLAAPLFRRYLELAPSAPDREYIEAYLKDIPS